MADEKGFTIRQTIVLETGWTAIYGGASLVGERYELWRDELPVRGWAVIASDGDDASPGMIVPIVLCPDTLNLVVADGNTYGEWSEAPLCVLPPSPTDQQKARAQEKVQTAYENEKSRCEADDRSRRLADEYARELAPDERPQRAVLHERFRAAGLTTRRADRAYGLLLERRRREERPRP